MCIYIISMCSTIEDVMSQNLTNLGGQVPHIGHTDICRQFKIQIEVRRHAMYTAFMYNMLKCTCS